MSANLGDMALPPGRPLADPLLEPDAGPRDASGEVVRAPLGNSIRTLVAFLALAALGVGVWWLQRPSDLTEQLAGTEWVVVEVDGEPLINDDGQVPAFALGRREMIRAGGPCGPSTGSWTFDTDDQRLEIEWPDGAVQGGCANEHAAWTIAAPTSGRAELRGDTLLVRGAPIVRAFEVSGRDRASVADVAGRWQVGDLRLEIGERGLFRLGECMGRWEDVGNGVRWAFESPATGCDRGDFWAGGDTFVPYRFETSLYLWRVPPGSAFDPFVVRLEPVPDTGSPLLDRP